MSFIKSYYPNNTPAEHALMCMANYEMFSIDRKIDIHYQNNLVVGIKIHPLVDDDHPTFIDYMYLLRRIHENYIYYSDEKLKENLNLALSILPKEYIHIDL
jgi:hypothetical protein